MDKIQFAIGKKPGPAHAAQDVAGFAVDATPFFNGALPCKRRFTLFDEQHFQAGMLAEIEGGKKTGRAAAHDDDVIVTAIG